MRLRREEMMSRVRVYRARCKLSRADARCALPLPQKACHLRRSTRPGRLWAQFKALCVKVDRGVAQSSLTTCASEQLSLPSPPIAKPVGASAFTGVGAAPLALARPRRR